MKGTSLIVAVVLSLAVAGLYVLHFTGSSKGSSSANSSQGAAGVPGSKIAYIKVDSLILNYDLAQDLHEEFTRKQEAYTSEYGARRTVFEREANEFQQKLQRGGFLTEQRAMQERDRLVSKEQEITKLDQELSGKLAEMQQANNQQLIENLISFLKTYNEGKKFDYILNSSDILIGPESVNITKEVLSQMNTRYQATKTAK